jgi:predicted Zn-dependent protease with MMP-like domain
MGRMSLREFGRVVEGVLETLPEEIARHLDNVVVDVEDRPDRTTLRHMGLTDEEIAAGESLYGLFVPLDVGMPDEVDLLDHPHRILIYKRPLEEDFPDERQLRTEIRKTVIHELAHHFGWTDRDLEKFDDNPDPFGDKA